MQVEPCAVGPVVPARLVVEMSRALSVMAKHLFVSDLTTRFTVWPLLEVATETCLLLPEAVAWKVSSGAEAVSSAISEVAVP